eukprot:SAG22_NODE_50_length_24611_cov_74.139687_8_plen_535_part_00
MNDKNFKLASGLVDTAYVEQARQARRVTEQLVKNLVAQRAIPDTGWSDASTQLLLRELAAMDSNNFPDNVGVGEREGRVFSGIVKDRHFGFSHGIGRSGDVMAVQPKAAGSSLVVQLTNYMAAHALRLSGFSNVKECIVLPTATGMTMTLALIALKASRPEATHVVWPRIDQKSCLKSIVTAGLVPVVVENLLEGDQLRTDVAGVERRIVEIGPAKVLCILSTSSCFAPRAHDKLEELAALASKHDVGHIVNNAYGVMSRTCMGSIAKAATVGRVDAVIQSTDKNFMVPVGGAVVATPKKTKTKTKGGERGARPDPSKGGGESAGAAAAQKPPAVDICTAISKLYPGRASGGPVLDLFITLLAMGCDGFNALLAKRVECMRYLREKMDVLAAANGERLLGTRNNTISMAMTLSTFTLDKAETSMLGSMLFSRCVSGTRVVTGVSKKAVAGIPFDGYGAHAAGYPTPYLTAAAAMGMEFSEVDTFVQRLQVVIDEFRKQHPPRQLLAPTAGMGTEAEPAEAEAEPAAEAEPEAET